MKPVQTDRPLVSLLYSILRDHISPGEVEQLVRDEEDAWEKVNHLAEGDGAPATVTLTNGYLAAYAKELGARLGRCRERNYCVDCNEEAWANYMVTDELWEEYGVGRRYLCLECYRKRAGTISLGDFPDVPANKTIRTAFLQGMRDHSECEDCCCDGCPR